MELLAAVGRDRLLVQTARQIAQIAAPIGVPIIWLKFAALRLLGHVKEGSRDATDLDVLVRPRDAARLQAELITHGFESSALPHWEQHLPALRSSVGVWLEVHDCLLGLREAPAGPSLTADDLLGSGTVIQSAELPAGSYAPTPELLLAHGIVHGYAQHGAAPSLYPLSRLFADVGDLGVGEPGWELSRDARGWLRNELTDSEIDAVIALSQTLARGDPPEALAPESPAELLLRHFVGGVVDPRYREKLKLAAVFRPVTDQSRVASLLHQLRSGLFPNRAQLEVIYGPSSSKRKLLLRRVLRPFDLGRRMAKYVWSVARLRLVARRSRR
jgi:hypothetical protein